MRVLSNLIASIWTRSICQMQATSPGVEFVRILSVLFRFKKGKENLSSYVHVLHKTENSEVSRRSRAVDVKMNVQDSGQIFRHGRGRFPVTWREGCSRRLLIGHLF